MPIGLVTGGSSGIGLAIARALREDGYDLTVSSRQPEKVGAAAEELGAHGVAADVSREEDCERLVAAHRDRFGGLDVLVNSAGIGIGGRIADLSTKYFDLQLAVNLRGLFLVTKLCLPLLKESRGWIVNLASIAGTIPTPGLPAYGASKAAVISLTRTLNAEHESDGIRAVAICPGFVDTPMAEWSGIPADEMIQPEDCAELVRYLLRLSPHARVQQIVIERLESGRQGLPG
jgi:NAD(P)-dependent dehydrogenase (short-subunit alcohol dehydrogenase family)